MKKITFSILLMFLVNTGYADCSGYSCSQVKIDRLVVYANGDVSINTDGDESLLDCDGGTYGYLKLYRTASNFDATYSLLLAAKSMDKTLNRIRTSSSGPCEIVYIIDQ